jgi:G:T-mismatch repair DNA endonuclease (very short patch repair protein)
MPKSRRRFWNAKITRNKERDRAVRRLLTLLRWRVLRVWEHSLKKREMVAAKVQAVLASQAGRD